MGTYVDVAWTMLIGGIPFELVLVAALIFGGSGADDA